MFYCFSCIRQPNLIDIVQYTFVRFSVVISVTLQYLFVFHRIFESNERNVVVIFITHEKDQRFFSYEFLVVIHTSNAVMQYLAFSNKVCRAFGYNADKSVFLRVFERDILHCYFRKFSIEFFTLFFVFERLFSCIFVCPYIVPTLEVVRQQILFLRNIQAEMFASLYVVAIAVYIRVLICDIVKEPFKASTFEKFFNFLFVAVRAECQLCLSVCLQALDIFTCPIRSYDNVDIAMRSENLFLIAYQSFAEGSVF